MARYYFNFRQGTSFDIDEAGCSFPTAEAAYLAAVDAAQEMWTDLLKHRQNPRECAFEITDEKGRELFTLPFDELLDAYTAKTKRPPSEQFAGALAIHKAASKAASDITERTDKVKVILQETARLLKGIE